MNQPPLNPDAERQCVELLLEYHGTPMHRLYEYPHRGDDSDRYIANAKSLLSKILAAALPEVTSVESIPAKMRMLMWEGGEVEVGEIPDGYVLVGFEMETDRAWSMADKVTINIERPEVKP